MLLTSLRIPCSLEYNIFKTNWENPLYYSVIMQPFIISPMINISDILCNVELLLQQKKMSLGITPKTWFHESLSDETLTKRDYGKHGRGLRLNC